MLASTTKKNIAKLQKVQNFAALIVTGTRKYDRPQYQVHTRNTRNKDKFNIIPFFTPAAGQQSFSYRAAQLWNTLPESFANIVI